MRNPLDGTVGRSSNGGFHRHGSEPNETASFHDKSNGRHHSEIVDQDMRKSQTNNNPFGVKMVASDDNKNDFATCVVDSHD